MTTLRNLTLGVAVLAAPALHAATVTYNDTMSVTEAANNTLTLSKFNPSLGTLTKVEITMSLSVPSFSIVVDNDSNNSANVTVSFANFGNTTFTSSASTFDGVDTLSGSNFGVATQSSSFTVGAQDGDSINSFDNDAGPDNGTFTTAPVLVGQLTPREIFSAFFSQWSGSGDVSLTLNTDFGTDLNLNSGGGGGDTRFQGTIPSATYFAEVTYTYTIPEPSAALLGSLGVLGLIRRRR